MGRESVRRESCGRVSGGASPEGSRINLGILGDAHVVAGTEDPEHLPRRGVKSIPAIAVIFVKIVNNRPGKPGMKDVI
jgi:hypothetical protein